jgi:hypothetical protein
MQGTDRPHIRCLLQILARFPAEADLDVTGRLSGRVLSRGYAGTRRPEQHPAVGDPEQDAAPNELGVDTHLCVQPGKNTAQRPRPAPQAAANIKKRSCCRQTQTSDDETKEVFVPPVVPLRAKVSR